MATTKLYFYRLEVKQNLNNDIPYEQIIIQTITGSYECQKLSTNGEYASALIDLVTGVVVKLKNQGFHVKPSCCHLEAFNLLN